MDILDKARPQDKIYRDPEDISDSEKDDDEKSADFEIEGFYEDNKSYKSVGVFTKIDNFDKQVLRKILQKETADYTPMGIQKVESEVKLLPDGDSTSKDFPFAEPKPRPSIMYGKNIPKKAPKVQFSVPIEEGKGQRPTFLSPEGVKQLTRRGTIRNEKLDVDVLRRYSIMKVI